MQYKEYLKETKKYEVVDLLIRKASEETLIQHFTNEHLDKILLFLDLQVPSTEHFEIEVLDYPEDFAKAITRQSEGTMSSGVSYKYYSVIGEIDLEKPDFDITQLNVVLSVRSSNLNGGTSQNTFYLLVLFPHEVPEPNQEVKDLLLSLS